MVESIQRHMPSQQPITQHDKEGYDVMIPPQKRSQQQKHNLVTVTKTTFLVAKELNKRTSRFCMGMQDKTRIGKTMRQPFRNWYSNSSLQTY
jgi:hypothetical protein